MYLKNLSFFTVQLDYIFFIYGLSFIILGVVTAILHLRKNDSYPWLWLAAFGFLHGSNEWVDLLKLSLPKTPLIEWTGHVIAAASFFALFAFGRHCLNRNAAVALAATLSAATAAALWTYPAEVGQIFRYLWGFPAATLSALLLWRIAVVRQSSYLKYASVSFGLYALAAGIVVPQGSFLLSSSLNYGTFLDLFGAPIQLFRMGLAITATMAIWFHYLSVHEHDGCAPDKLHPNFIRKLTLLLGIIIVSGFYFVNLMGERKESLMVKEFLSRITIVANLVDRSNIESLKGDERDLASRSYPALKEWLSRVNVASRFTYLMTLENGEAHFLADSEAPDSPDCSPPGQLYEEASAQFLSGLSLHTPFIIGPETDRWGTYITAVIPLEYSLSDGRPVYLLSDIDYAEWANDVALSRQIAIFIVLLGSVLTLYFFFASGKIYQINARLKAERNLFIGGPAIVIKWKIEEGRWHVLYASSNLQSHLNITPETVTDHTYLFTDHIHPEDRTMIVEGISTLASDRNEFEHELRLLHADGSYRWFYLFVIRQSDRYSEWFQGYFTEISTQKAAQESAAYLATHDILTGLPKLTILEEFFQKAKASAKRNHLKAALLYLDLDRFNRINDAYGHAFGNDLIVRVSKRLQQILPENATIGREGGDEFIILVPDIHDNDEIALLAQKIQWEIGKPLPVDGESIILTCSIGVAVFPDDAQFLGSLLQQADLALNNAKQNGKAIYVFASRYANEEMTHRLMIETHLHTALEKKEFTLHYQPKIDHRSGKVTGAEALIRWENPALGKVSPADFIPIAEENGLIIPIGKWVLEEACRQTRLWQEQGLPPLHIAVNVSALQLKRPEFITGIKTLLEESSLLPCYLELELTESILAKEHDLIISTLRELREMGMEISIDDFGTGYSNFLYLKQFNVSKLKIDQSFVADMNRNKEVKTIVETMVKFAGALNLSTIAEGVETADQLETLAEFGCDEIQGYYFSRPLPPEEFERYYASINGTSTPA